MLAEWTVRCCEHKVYGVFDPTGRAGRFTVGQMVEGIRSTLAANASLVHASSAFLAAQDPPVRGWSDLPVWIAPRRLRRVHASGASPARSPWG